MKRDYENKAVVGQQDKAEPKPKVKKGKALQPAAPSKMAHGPTQNHD